MNIMKTKLRMMKNVSHDSSCIFKKIILNISQIYTGLLFPVKCDVCKCDYSNRDNPVTDKACDPTISQNNKDGGNGDNNNNSDENSNTNGTGLPLCSNTTGHLLKSFNSGTGETAFIIRIFEEVRDCDNSFAGFAKNE